MCDSPLHALSSHVLDVYPQWICAVTLFIHVTYPHSTPAALRSRANKDPSRTRGSHRPHSGGALASGHAVMPASSTTDVIQAAGATGASVIGMPSHDRFASASGPHRVSSTFYVAIDVLRGGGAAGGNRGHIVAPRPRMTDPFTRRCDNGEISPSSSTQSYISFHGEATLMIYGRRSSLSNTIPYRKQPADVLRFDPPSAAPP